MQVLRLLHPLQDLIVQPNQLILHRLVLLLELRRELLLLMRDEPGGTSRGP